MLKPPSSLLTHLEVIQARHQRTFTGVAQEVHRGRVPKVPGFTLR